MITGVSSLVCLLALCFHIAGCYLQHYENKPIQIYWKFYHQKMKIFSWKILIFFHISAHNIDCWYSLEPPHRGGSNKYPQSMFWAEIRKIMYTPVNPSFTIEKWGLRGSKLYRHVFVMTYKDPIVMVCSYTELLTVNGILDTGFWNTLIALVLFWDHSRYDTSTCFVDKLLKLWNVWGMERL